jgi:ribonuclease E
VLRSLEDQLLKGVTHDLTIRTRTSVALYILNQKRPNLSELEQRFGLTITVLADESITNGSHFAVERGEPVTPRPLITTTVQPDSVQPSDELEEEALDEAAAEAEIEEAEELAADGEEERESRGERGERSDQEEPGRRRRRRRRRRGGEPRGETRPQMGEAHGVGAGEEVREDEEGEEETGEDEQLSTQPRAEGAAGEEGPDGERRKRRRGRRGGRRGRRGREGQGGEDRGRHDRPNGGAAEEPAYRAEPTFVEEGSATPDETPQPFVSREVPAEPVFQPAEARSLPEPEPERESRQVEKIEATFEPTPALERPAERVAPKPVVEEDDPNRPKRSGWWQRRSFF